MVTLERATYINVSAATMTSLYISSFSIELSENASVYLNIYKSVLFSSTIFCWALSTSEYSFFKTTIGTTLMAKFM